MGPDELVWRKSPPERAGVGSLPPPPWSLHIPAPAALHPRPCPSEEVTEPGSQGGLLLLIRPCPGISDIPLYVCEASSAPWPQSMIYIYIYLFFLPEDPYPLHND